MNDLYLFGNGVYDFQNLIDPVLELELKKCKTQEERNDVIQAYQSTSVLSLVVAIVLGTVICGVIALFIK